MSETPHAEVERATATAGDIAAQNLESARQRCWNRFWRAPDQPQVAESIVEHEQLAAQYLGDLAAFDRLDMLVGELSHAEPHTARSALIAAQVACSTHRFADARQNLAEAGERGPWTEACDRLALTLDQATGTDLPAVLAARRARASRPGRWEERIPLAALLADLGEFDEAERVYLQALREYPDVSPFPLAWACFQLGALWGECVPAPQPLRAARWYRSALDYLPCYVKARVHLAEICIDDGDFDEARALLVPVIDSGDPEVAWRLADAAAGAGDRGESALQLEAARRGFESLLDRHLLAFADHGAEFYAGSGADPVRAFELAQVNLANRPTPRARQQAREIGMFLKRAMETADASI